MKTLREQLECAQRELGKRKGVYPKWVREGKLTQQKADHEIACMEDIVQTLQKANVLYEVSMEIAATWPKETEAPAPRPPQPTLPLAGEECAFCQTISAPGDVACSRCGKPLYRALMAAAKKGQ